MRTENYPKGTGLVVSFKIYKRVIKDYIREIVCNFFLQMWKYLQNYKSCNCMKGVKYGSI